MEDQSTLVSSSKASQPGDQPCPAAEDSSGVSMVTERNSWLSSLSTSPLASSPPDSLSGPRPPPAQEERTAARGTAVRGVAPGGISDNFSWMSQPGLVFEMGTEVALSGRTAGETARSDPSSASSSQDEDSLERLTPDSPFEDLTEKTTGQEVGQDAAILGAPSLRDPRSQPPQGLEEVHLPVSCTQTTNKAEDAELSTMADVLQNIQPKLAGSTTTVPLPPGQGLQSKFFSDLDVDLDLGPSVGLVTITGAKSSMGTLTIQSSRPTVVRVTESSTRVVDPKSPADSLVSVPSPEMPPGGPTDAVRTSSSFVQEMSRPLQQAPSVQSPAAVPALDRPQPEPTEVDSSGESEDTVIEDLKGPPTCQMVPAGGLQTPVPVLVTGAGEVRQESGAGDRQVGTVTGDAGSQPGDARAKVDQGELTKTSQMEDHFSLAKGLKLDTQAELTADFKIEDHIDLAKGSLAGNQDQELTKTSKMEDHVDLAKGLKLDTQAELTKALKIEDHIDLAKGSLVGNQELTKTSKMEDHVSLAKELKLDTQAELTKASKMEDHVVLEQTERTKASKTEDHVGSAKGWKVDNQVELAKTSMIEVQAKDLKMEDGGLAKDSTTGGQFWPAKASKTEGQAGLTKGSKVEDLVGLSRAPTPDQGGLHEASQVEARSKVEMVGLTLGPAGTSAPGKEPDPATSPTPEMAAQTPGSPEEETDLGDTSTSLLEMIRRSEMQRGQLSRDEESTPCVADRSEAVVPSAPVHGEIPSLMVKPLRSMGHEPMDLDLTGKVGLMDLDLQTKVKPVDLDLQKKVGSVDMDLQNKFASVDRDLQTKVGPMDLDLQKKVGSVDLDLQNKVGSLDLDLQTKVKPVAQDLQTKVKPVDQDLQTKVGPVDQDLQTKVKPVDLDLQTKVGSDLDLQTKVGSVDLDLRGKVGPMDLDLQKKVGSVDMDLQNKFASVDRDLQTKVKPVDQDLQTKVGSVDLDLQKKVGSVDLDLQNKVGSLDRDLQSKVGLDLDLQTKVAPVDLVLQTKVKPMELDLKNKMGPVDLDLRTKVGPVELDLKNKMGSVDQDLKNKMGPVDLDLQKKVGSVDMDLQNKFASVDRDLQTKVGPVDLDLQTKVKPVALDLQKKVETVDQDLQTKVGPVDMDLLGDVGPIADAPSRDPRPGPDEAPAGAVKEPVGGQNWESPGPSPPSRDLATPTPGGSGHAGPADSGTPALGEASERPRQIRTPARELVYWTDRRKSAAVFGSTLTLLVSLAVFSVVSVLAYLVLALLSVTITFRVYRSVLQAVQKTQDGNPFKAYLEQDVTVSPDTFHHYCTTGLTYVNQALKYLLRLFLVHDLIDSLKLTALMWLMTYVGAVFNGLTLLILALLLTFSVPAVYKKYQTEVDQYLDVAQKQFNSIVEKIQEKIPGTKRKTE